MNSKYLIAALVLIAIVAAGWFFVSPLFLDKVVDEPLSALTPVKVAAMSSSDRDKLMSKLMNEAAETSHSVDEAMDTMGQSPLVVATGRFKDADAIHKGSGRASLYRLADRSHVIRLEDFKVTNGPALVVLLAHVADPENAGEVQKSYIKLGDLKGNIGNQNYRVPDNINVGQYRSVVIWCELFGVLFSSATLNAT